MRFVNAVSSHGDLYDPCSHIYACISKVFNMVCTCICEEGGVCFDDILRWIPL